MQFWKLVFFEFFEELTHFFEKKQKDGFKFLKIDFDKKNNKIRLQNIFCFENSFQNIFSKAKFKKSNQTKASS